jgi:hypothetical protein
VKHGMLALLLLSGCWTNDYTPTIYEYRLTWTCLSPEGCERAADVQRIDRMKEVDRECHFTSTQDQTFAANATLIYTSLLAGPCSWLSFLSLFGHELEQSVFCYGPGGLELELAIPNQDSTTYSMWLVEGRDVNLL